MDTNTDFLTIEDLCQQFHISRSSVYNLIRSGAVSGIKIGSLWRIPKSSVDQYLSAKLTEKP